MATHAFVVPGGAIGFGRRTPSYGLTLTHGPKRKVVEVIQAIGRLSYDNETYLVPGVPEASTKKEAILAIGRFAHAIRSCLGAADRCGQIDLVEFEGMVEADVEISELPAKTVDGARP